MGQFSSSQGYGSVRAAAYVARSASPWHAATAMPRWQARQRAPAQRHEGALASEPSVLAPGCAISSQGSAQREGLPRL